MRRFLALTAATTATVLSTIGWLPFTGFAFAQTAGTAGPVSLGELFTAPDLAILKSDSADRLKNAAQNALAAGNNLAPGQCPKPRITVTVEKGDPLYQEALVAARRDALGAVLGNDAGRFAFVTNHEGAANKVEIDASVTDGGPPIITVDPPSGTPVSKGDRLTITVTVTEPTTGWQTGLKQIQIEDVERHTNLENWINDAATPRPCGNAGLTKTIQKSYTVPDVQMAHLKITARDYHHPQQVPTVAYPVGEWHGRIETDAQHTTLKHATLVRFAFNLKRDGTLDGRAWVKFTNEEVSKGNCSWSWAVSPNPFEVAVSGRRNGDQFEIALSTAGSSSVTTTLKGGCAAHWGGTYSKTDPYQTNPLVPTPMIGYRPELHPHGTNTMVFRVLAEDGASHVQPLEVPGGSYQYNIKVQKAR